MISVSFICPTFNRPEWMPHLLDTFTSQDVGDKQLVVIDDSPEPSSVMQRATLDDARVIYVWSPKRSTIGEKRNRACALARGEFIVQLDDDDTYDSGWGSLCADRLRLGAHVVKLSVWRALRVADGSLWRWDTRQCGGKQYAVTSNSVDGPMVAEPDHRYCQRVLDGYGFSMSFTRAAWERVKFQDMSIGEDHDFVTRARAYGYDVEYIDDADGMIIHRIHPKSSGPIFPQEFLGYSSRRMGAGAEPPEVQVRPGGRYKGTALLKQNHTEKDVRAKLDSFGLHVESWKDGESGVPGYHRIEFVVRAGPAASGTFPMSLPAPMKWIDKSHVEKIGAGSDMDWSVESVSAHTPVGAGLSFDEIHQDPDFAKKWDEIAKDIPPEDMKLATASAEAAFSHIAEVAGLSGPEANTAVIEFTKAARTVSGSVQMIEGFANAAKSGITPGQLVQLSAGTLIGTLGLVGVSVNPAVGAAIIVGATILGEIGDALFGGKDPGVDICGAKWNPPPVYKVGCLGMYNQPTVSATGGGGDNPAWIKFEQLERGEGQFALQSIKARSSLDNQYGETLRAIDRAFPQYVWLECEREHEYQFYRAGIRDIGLVRGAAVVDFLQTFLAAWKANAERALNGMRAVEDWQVLAHHVMMWNRAHDEGDGFEFFQISDAADMNVAIKQNLRGDEVANNCPTPYVASLVDTIRHAAGGDIQDRVLRNGHIFIHTGDRKKSNQFGKIGGFIVTNPSGSKPSPGASIGEVAIGTGLVAGTVAAGIGLYAIVQGISFAAAMDLAWAAFTSTFAEGGRVLQTAGPKSLTVGAGERSSTRVQSLLFSREHGWTPSKAKAWAKSRGKRYGKVDVTDRYVRLRQEEPTGKFKRTIDIDASRGIRAVVQR